jgi:hypothetical protein
MNSMIESSVELYTTAIKGQSFVDQFFSHATSMSAAVGDRPLQWFWTMSTSMTDMLLAFPYLTGHPLFPRCLRLQNVVHFGPAE